MAEKERKREKGFGNHCGARDTLKGATFNANTRPQEASHGEMAPETHL